MQPLPVKSDRKPSLSAIPDLLCTRTFCYHHVLHSCMSLYVCRSRILTSSSFHCPSFTPFLHLRTFTHSTSLASPHPPTSSSSSKMSPPAKKMYHLESINAIPSQYPEFRNVLWTGESSQLVVMTVPVGGDIGEEVGVPPFLQIWSVVFDHGFILGAFCGSAFDLHERAGKGYSCRGREGCEGRGSGDRAAGNET